MASKGSLYEDNIQSKNKIVSCLNSAQKNPFLPQNINSTHKLTQNINFEGSKNINNVCAPVNINPNANNIQLNNNNNNNINNNVNQIPLKKPNIFNRQFLPEGMPNNINIPNNINDNGHIPERNNKSLNNRNDNRQNKNNNDNANSRKSFNSFYSKDDDKKKGKKQKYNNSKNETKVLYS
jgi:hypothetical protein